MLLFILSNFLSYHANFYYNSKNKIQYRDAIKPEHILLFLLINQINSNPFFHIRRDSGPSPTQIKTAARRALHLRRAGAGAENPRPCAATPAARRGATGGSAVRPVQPQRSG
jgi:hypothetical protein